MRSLAALLIVAAVAPVLGGAAPVRARTGMVAAQDGLAARVGAEVIRAGGNAIDAAVATAFALAVTLPAAGNIGGGGFLVYRPAAGEPVAYDFRETAPARASATMFLRDGHYDAALHHDGYLAVGVPGTVAGLHLAWREHGTRPWKTLIDPAIALARDGFVVSDALARSLAAALPTFQKVSPAAVAQFSKNGTPYQAGERLRQPDLARTLERIAARGPAGFYDGETALAIERDMLAHGGLITRADLRSYQAVRRVPIRGSYRGYDVVSMPPPSSGGIALVQMLNVLERYDLAGMGPGSAAAVHVMAEAMRRAYADRARYIGDPEANPAMPVARLISKDYANQLRQSIDANRASPSSPDRFDWPGEHDETTHVSVVDRARHAVSLTYTLEALYGVGVVVPGAGFLLNNEMGDFNAAPGLTNADGLIGTAPNLAAPGKRMLSSMTPTILAKDGTLFMVTGTPGGRTIINTVLQTILNVVDFGMNAQDAADFPRFHHQWLPDRVQVERYGLSPDTINALEQRGHTVAVRPAGGTQGVAQVIVYDRANDLLEGGSDRRGADGAAVGGR